MAGEGDISDVPGDDALGAEPPASVPWWGKPPEDGEASPSEAFADHIRRGGPWTGADADEPSSEAPRDEPSGDTRPRLEASAYGAPADEDSPAAPGDEQPSPHEAPPDEVPALAPAGEQTSAYGPPAGRGASAYEVPAGEAPTWVAVDDEALDDDEADTSDARAGARLGGPVKWIAGLAVAMLVMTFVAAGMALTSDGGQAEEDAAGGRTPRSSTDAPERRSSTSTRSGVPAGASITVPSTTSPSSTGRATTTDVPATGAPAATAGVQSRPMSPVAPPPPPPGSSQPPPASTPRAEAYNDSSSCTTLGDTVEVWATVEWTDGFVDSAVVVYDSPGRHTLAMARMWSFTFDVIAPPAGAIGNLSCVALGGGGPTTWP